MSLLFNYVIIKVVFDMKNKSKFRQLYIKRIVVRIIIFIITIGIYILNPDTFNVVKGFNMIKFFSPLWLIWMIDMILQLCKVPKYWPLGSQKYWAHRYLPDIKKINKNAIKRHMDELNNGSIAVAIIWILFVSIIDILYLTNVISYQIVILISTAFYVCDVICIVVWCPFRVIFMHNKCCTTCRIFNWDHAMMFLPLIVIPGLWTYSLLFMSILILIVWEIACALHPERFLEMTNCALRCSNCDDKLCGKNIANK